MSDPTTPRRAWRALVAPAAVVAVLATVGAAAAVWPGFDAQQTPLQDASVWALQTGQGRNYARVNTQLREIDTVKQVENPSGIAQSAGTLFVFTDGGTKYADVSPAAPPDLNADAADVLESTPSGTTTVASSGDYVAYLTEGGDVYAGQLSAGGAVTAIDPFADQPVAEGEERERIDADAIAVTEDGVVSAMSLGRQQLFTARADTGEILAEESIAVSDVDDLQLTSVGERWIALDAASGTVWIQGSDDALVLDDLDESARLQRPVADGDVVFIADSSGLVSVPLAGGAPERIVNAVGTPAPPTALGDVVYAAWLTTDAGTWWSSAQGAASELDYAGATLGDQIPSPEIAVNSGRGIINEQSSGWVWTLPDGLIVPSSQEWRSDEASLQQEQQEDLAPEQVLDPKPPVAEPDAFGVRAGRDVILPVLLNDHDPNEDVLSVAADSIVGLDPAFGTVRLANESQQLVVTVAPTASGSASFSYRVTDGTTADGLLSEPATVTLTVVPDGINNAPLWCGGDPTCLAVWPTPEVVPGGTTTVEVLDAWVDPDGDPIYLSDAANLSGIGTVASDPAGRLTYQHPDPNETNAQTIQIDLTVSDVFGASTSQPLTISVTPAPELTADSFAVTAQTGLALSVDLGAHVHGRNGTVTLGAVKTLNGSSAAVVPNSSGLAFTFRSDEPGSHVVQYTVRDDSGEASAVARITVVDPAATLISTPPLTAFVRPNEDASIDVLSAVENPADWVLLVSDLRPEPAEGSSLSVDAVAQSLIRVSGSTADGSPGLLGTVGYTISDGTGNASATARGELTVILLPTPSAKPPIATDDTVTVRAGSLIDIPVLENDTAPSGALVAIDPSRIVNESDAGLAFATSRVVRYLAPSAAGTYSIGYTVYRLGFPEMIDSARIFVTVLPSDTNTAPVPTGLEGRVLSGNAVSIPFDGFGIDPDGDNVVLDRIISQPAQGSAAISAEADAIVYTSNPGSRGQDEFVYQVRDARGETATATVRIGVLDAASDPSPVTYSDYAQAQAGAANSVIVYPADNDIDPAGSELELLEVRPNAQPDTDEFARLEAMLDYDTETGAVTLQAGTELGTYSFIYTVRNRTGDTAQGLIVLKVVRNPVPDFPVVRDTVLTAETREDLTSGVDVVSGKVTWTGGDVSQLSLSLWGDAAGFTANGWTISGEAPENSTIVPFEVRGIGFSGTEVVTYGFLRIPGERDIELTLRAGYAEREVNEEASVEFDMSEAVAFPRGEQLVVDAAGVAATGSRNGQCALVSGTTIRYDAGPGGPWTDVCTVPVRLASQEDLTYLAVRLKVIAKAPQPELRSASLSISPGASSQYDLSSMTTWNGEPDWASLQYAIEYGGDQFEIALSGASLSITGVDAARPGREEPVVVRLTSHPEAAAATLTLTVGPAPSTLPKGGTATQQCSQSGGSTSCTISVIGAAGEVNPLPGTPLALTSVTSPANCPDVSFTVASATAVTATWASDAAGAADCTGSFTVTDAQQRSSSGDRNGTVILDLQGLPADPARVNWTNYNADTVTLQVISESSSYPAITGYRVSGSNGSEVTCDASGRCPAIAAGPADIGAPGTTFEARAVSAVGESRSAVSVEAYSYQAPAAPSSVASVPAGDGIATITVGIADSSTGSVSLRIGSQTIAEQPVAGSGEVTFASVPVGTNLGGTIVDAVPMTKHRVPPNDIVAGGSSEGRTSPVEAWGIGAPSIALVADTSGDAGTVTLTASVDASNGNQATLFLGIAATVDGCTPDQNSGVETGSTTRTFTASSIFESHTYYACGRYEFGGTTFALGRAETSATATGSVPAPVAASSTYEIAFDASTGDSRTTSVIARPSVSTTGPQYFVRYDSEHAGTATNFDDLFSSVGVDPGAIVAVQCATVAPENCTPSGSAIAITPEGAAYRVTVEFGACAAGVIPDPEVRAAASTDYVVTTNQETNVATVSFEDRLAGLSTQTRDYTGCDPEPEPETDPAPDPTDETTP